MTRKYPPSYYRYIRSHPAISLRLTESLKKALDAYRGSLSYARAIRKLLEEKEDIIKFKAEAEEEKKKAKEEGFNEGFSAALHMFIENPDEFYKKLMEKASSLKLKDFEPALFTVPCAICGQPMIFTHTDSHWQKKTRPKLHATFANWVHAACKKKQVRIR
jgi:hypothetical protein